MPSFEARSVLALAPALLAACSLSGGARDAFSRAKSCPADQVAVVARPDYRVPMPPDSPPPADIAAAPDRLAMWQQQHTKQRAAIERGCGADFFEVTGCGQRAILCCGHPYHPPGQDTPQVSCDWGYPGYPLPGQAPTVSAPDAPPQPTTAPASAGP
jgi:hypothetical protein